MNLSAAYVKYRIKTVWDRFDDAEVRQARSIAHRGRHDRLDVLQFGESTTRWISPADLDRRPLWAMVADGLVRPQSHLAVHGGSYSAELYEAYLQFALQVATPQAVIVPLWCRGRLLPWIEHPRFGKRLAAGAIADLRGNAPLWSMRRAFPQPTEGDWDRFHALPVETLAGLETIGEHVSALKDEARWTNDAAGREKLIYAYHHGQQIDTFGTSVNAVESLGRALARFDGPVVVYETPVCEARGVRHWGDPLSRIVDDNFTVLREALRRGYGRDLPILQTGRGFDEDEFVDPSLADEHLNERGRRRLTREILDALSAQRPDLVRA